jgi:hypothetical protein
VVVVIGSAVAVFGFTIGQGQAVGLPNLHQICQGAVNGSQSDLLTLLDQGLVELLGRYEANGLV